MSNKLLVGRFGRPFGVKGWVKVISYTRPADKILDYTPWYIKIEKTWVVSHIISGKLHGTEIIVHLENCFDRNKASALTNVDIAIDKSQLPKLDPDEFYWDDLIGLLVVNTKNEELGRVDYLIETGSNDVLVVKGVKEYLIPYIDTVVLEVDLKSQKIVVDWDLDF
jgi:16S rRNA processing protein RimM